MGDDRASAALSCTNCGATLAGPYCHGCGQKRFADSDRRLSHLLGEGFRELTSLDGRLWRSLRMLLFRPGLLSREYLDGRRARYYTPVGLFVLANVLYFFAPIISDFNLKFVDQVPGRIALQALDPAAPRYAERAQRLPRSGGQFHSRWSAGLVERRVAGLPDAERAAALRKLALDYDHQAGDVGKALMIVHVPVLAFGLMLVNWRRRMYFAEHFVVALHLFTVLLLYIEALGLVSSIIGRYLLPDLGAADPAPALRLGLILFRLVVLGAPLAYAGLACRRVYGLGVAFAAANVLALLVALYVANLWLYRALQFVVTLALI